MKLIECDGCGGGESEGEVVEGGWSVTGGCVGSVGHVLGGGWCSRVVGGGWLSGWAVGG